MKALKIILTLAVVVGIGYFIYISSSSGTDYETKCVFSENLHVQEINKKIDTLGSLPNDSFSKDYYNLTMQHIETCHQQNLFSKVKKENDLWKANLSQNLFSAYAPKFIDEAKYVFNGSKWSWEDINFIQKEIKFLKESGYLQLESPISNSLDEFNKALVKYYEIKNFLSSCRNFNFSDYKLKSEFPDLKNKINKSRTYLNNNLDNSYVNNCTRLKDTLKKIPSNFFKKHIKYLQTKLEKYSNRYENYEKQKEYIDSIYYPLEAQIDVLKNDIYRTKYRKIYNDLKGILDADVNNATIFFKQKKNENE